MKILKLCSCYLFFILISVISPGQMWIFNIVLISNPQLLTEHSTETNKISACTKKHIDFSVFPEPKRDFQHCTEEGIHHNRSLPLQGFFFFTGIEVLHLLFILRSHWFYGFPELIGYLVKFRRGDIHLYSTTLISKKVYGCKWETIQHYS